MDLPFVDAKFSIFGSGHLCGKSMDDAAIPCRYCRLLVLGSILFQPSRCLRPQTPEPMISSQEKTIFGKLAYQICEEILEGKYHSEDRIPSVRDLAETFEVNYNTILRAMELLQREEIVYQKRGIGYFVSPNARQRILRAHKREFMQQRLPEVFRQARLLGITLDEITQFWNEEAANQGG